MKLTPDFIAFLRRWICAGSLFNPKPRVSP